jgi:hypothetical protein
MACEIPSLKRRLTELDKERDKVRAELSDMALCEELSKVDSDYFCMDKDAQKAAIQAKIEKRRARRAKELATLGTYVRPGAWDDDLDTYPEHCYETEVDDGYKIRLNRAHDMTWNGYVVLPDNHPASGKHHNFFSVYPPHGFPYAPVGLSYGGVDPMNPIYPLPERGVYGFYFGHTVAPRPYYGEYNPRYTTFYRFSSEETGGFIDYKSMYSHCLKLVEYFKNIAATPALVTLVRDVSFCVDCRVHYTGAVCERCTCMIHNLAMSDGVCDFCKDDKTRKRKRTWASVVSGC